MISYFMKCVLYLSRRCLEKPGNLIIIVAMMNSRDASNPGRFADVQNGPVPNLKGDCE
jgi:hypothetical protein